MGEAVSNTAPNCWGMCKHLLCGGHTRHSTRAKPSHQCTSHQCNAMPHSSCSPLSLMNDWSHLAQSAHLLGERRAGKVPHWGQPAVLRLLPTVILQWAWAAGFLHTPPLLPVVCSPFCCWQL